MLNAIYRFVREEEGASAAEYALLLVLITLGIAGDDGTRYEYQHGRHHRGRDSGPKLIL